MKPFVKRIFVGLFEILLFALFLVLALYLATGTVAILNHSYGPVFMYVNKNAPFAVAFMLWGLLFGWFYQRLTKTI